MDFGNEKHVAAVLAFATTFMVAGIFGALFFAPLPQGNHDLIASLTPIVLTAWAGALGNYFRSRQTTGQPGTATVDATITATTDPK